MRLLVLIALLRATTQGLHGTTSCGGGLFNPYERNPKRSARVRRGDFPWLLSLQTKDGHKKDYQHTCSATLLSCHWAITAAHCVVDTKHYLQNLRLVAGSISLKDDRKTQILKPQKIILHPKFKEKEQNGIYTFANDFALIKLESPADLSQSNVGTICLPTQGGCADNQKHCFVAGWGGASKLKTKAQASAVESVSDLGCDIAWGKIRIHRNSAVCLFPSERSSLNVQDAGSPLQCLGAEDRFELFGVMSYAPKTKNLDSIPSVYADTTAVLQWIRKTIRSGDKCPKVPPKPTVPTPPSTTTIPRPSDCKDPLRGVRGILDTSSDLLTGAKTSDTSEDASSPFFSVKVIQGMDAERGSWPWQLALRRRGRVLPFCGATLLSCRYAMTACHCVLERRVNISMVEIVAGATNLRDDGDVSQRRNIRKVHFNPMCNRSASIFTDDLAILELEEEVQLTDSVRTIRLPDPGDDFTDGKCYVSGWGLNDSDPSIAMQPPALQEARVNVWDRDRCESVLNTETPRKFDESNICIDGPRPCFGDSGGPLQCLRDGTYRLAGVSSFTFTIEEPQDDGTSRTVFCYMNLPSGFSSVARHVDWIRSVTNIRH